MARDSVTWRGTGVRGEVSLLDNIAQNALDDDYYAVTEHRPVKRSVWWSWRTAVVLGLFGALVTLAASQTRLDRPNVQAQRSVLIATLHDRSDDLDAAQAELLSLTAEIDDLRAIVDRRSGQRDIAALNGSHAVHGPGLSIVLNHGDDRVSVFDLQRTVNGLWGAGAEAISLNGHRLTGLSAVRTANNAIVVNYTSVSAPYVVTAIGDPAELAERFALVDGGHHLRRRTDAGLVVDYVEHTDVSLPSAPQNRVTLDHAAPVAERSAAEQSGEEP